MDKDYVQVDPAHMLDDPAQAAVAYDLVDKHDPLAIRLVGAWRWKALQAHVQDLRQIASQRYTVDVGGAAGPIGYNSIIVDRQADKVALYDVKGRPDAIFCVHTLEHIEDTELFVWSVAKKLRPQGQFVVVVPSYQHEHLRAEEWPWHKHTFCLREEDGVDATPLEPIIGEHFDIAASEYVDGDILIVAQLPE